MGVSYGAATAFERAGRDRRVEAVVAIAPFASPREVVPNCVALFAPRLAPLLPAALVDRVIDRGGRAAGFDPDEASPLDAIARARAHVLLSHGGAGRLNSARARRAAARARGGPGRAHAVRRRRRLRHRRRPHGPAPGPDRGVARSVARRPLSGPARVEPPPRPRHGRFRARVTPPRG
jgi:hypothetical protein